MNIPAWITVDEANGAADCAACHTGMTVPSLKFGPISLPTLLATFVVQHATHSRQGYASGLTSAGNATKAARAVIAGTEGDRNA